MAFRFLLLPAPYTPEADAWNCDIQKPAPSPSLYGNFDDDTGWDMDLATIAT